MTYNKVTQGPIISTFFLFAFPALIALLAITTASLVDGIFVGKYLGPQALAAINILIPYITFMFALGLMVAIGGTVTAGKFIGEGNYKEANGIFTLSLISIFLFATLMAIISLFFNETLFLFLGVDEQLTPLTQAYFQVISVVLTIQLTTMVLYYFVRADGFPTLATTALVLGSVINIMLDVLFLGYFKWGIQSAAWATGIAQIIQLLVLCTFFTKKQRLIKFQLCYSSVKPYFRGLLNGISEYINEISVGIVIFTIHWLLMKEQGNTAISGFAVANYMLFISMMLFYGIIDALHILVSQNYGARNFTRINQFMLLATITVISISTLLILSALSVSDLITKLFIENTESDAYQLALSYIGVIWPCFIFSGINVLLSCYFTAMHCPLQSSIIALSRGLVLPVSLLLLFTNFIPSIPFLFALPIAELSAFIIALTLYLRFQHNIKQKFELVTL
ncbi:MATE family efflux transporter [Photobacterium angustum]|uniref:MATE family efflux transporter n=1 Tax=Photobacterium angustum TaxID=661 RepID=UPI0009BC2CDD|nr:MATE family efflux transporter [Photobacterium angustum]PSV67938.1 multidrug transporter MatE [Photobacterium angustum]